MSYHRWYIKVGRCRCTPRCETLGKCHAPQMITVPHGSFEVFYNASINPDFVLNPEESRTEQEPAPIGWYWWSCFPGCLPDSDPYGPYESEEEAIQAARMEET